MVIHPLHVWTKQKFFIKSKKTLDKPRHLAYINYINNEPEVKRMVMNFNIANSTVNVRYSDARNRMFEKTVASTVCSIAERYEDVLALSRTNARMRSRIEQALVAFEFNNEDLLTWEEFSATLPSSCLLTFEQIWVDKTLQRIPDLEAIERYIGKFKGFKVQPIRVYYNEEVGKYVCWDGQHTVIMLWLIVMYALRVNPAKLEIPVVINKSNRVDEMREALMSENGDGRTLFDEVDMFEQFVFAVRHDESKKPAHLVAEQKQQYLEDAGMFLANPRRHEDDQPGALTRTQEILDMRYDHVVTKYFTQWCKALNDANRPFGGTEVDLMYYFWNRCHTTDFNVDLRYINKVARVCQKVQDGDFNGNVFWERVKVSYETWFRETQSALPEEQRQRISHEGEKQEKMLTFLCAMLSDAGVETPKITPRYPVDKEDLF
jgi:hypothetical protein